VTAPVAGRLRLRVSLGDEVAVGGLLFEISVSDSAVNGARSPLTEPSAIVIRAGAVPTASRPAGPDTDSATAEPAVLSAAAQRQADSLGVAPERFASGSWLTAADVRAIAGQTPSTSAARQHPGTESPRAERQSKRKQVEIRNLSVGNAHGLISSVAVELGAPTQRLVQAPPLFRETIADLVVFEGARLLREFPRLNGCWVDDRHVRAFSAVHFGVTFDSGENLKVLAIRDADRRSLADVQAEFTRLLELYESGAPIDEQLLESATVTLSDLSATGISRMQPLVNGRQALILGLTRPFADRYSLCATFDHRVTEGLAVARFVVALGERVSSYFRSGPPATELRCSGCQKSIAEEIDLGGRGFVDVTLADGTKGMLCRSCFNGY
jgi:pyruvate/2-oxoglutarate dehydrogenase complex dihydrolipoamide acyltransferase (E2) component